MPLYDVKKGALDKIKSDFAYKGEEIGSKIVTYRKTTLNHFNEYLACFYRIAGQRGSYL